MLTEATKQDVIDIFASNAHEEWRKGFDSEYAKTGTPSKERVKDNGDGTSGNIHIAFKNLHPKWKKENLAAGQAAHEAVTKFPNDIESASEHIHNEWMKRNPKEDYNKDQHVTYNELPESEKEKDRVHVRTMQDLMK